MSTPNPSDEHTEQLEEIAAYLDGELSPVESALVEKKLSSDDEFRQELQCIDRAWAALDQLLKPWWTISFYKPPWSW